MIPVSYRKRVISKITVAYFLDSGLYSLSFGEESEDDFQANAGQLFWGRNKGDDFFNNFFNYETNKLFYNKNDRGYTVRCKVDPRVK